MTGVFIMIVGAAVIFGASAAWGLVWAIRTGQMRRFNQGAASIFDDEEPIGRVTDVFPGQAPPPPTDGGHPNNPKIGWRG